MGYNSAIQALRDKCETAKGNLYFDIGTIRDFNEKDNRDFPLVFVRRPITSTKVKNANNVIVQEVFNINLQVLQACKLDTQNVDLEKYFQDMNYIAVALLNDLLSKDFQISTGTAIQINKTTDLVVVGWEIPIQLTVDVDSDLCCSFFES